MEHSLSKFDSRLKDVIGGPLVFEIWKPPDGPLFTLYCLCCTTMMSHSYADDVQAYKHCLASQAHSAIRIVSHATDTLNAWMSSNRLLLNPQKSQYIWFGTCQQLDKLDLAALSLEFPTFVFSTSVRDLGVILDQELSFVDHITALTRSCFYHLRQLRVVSRSLSATSTATLVHAFIVNRLDHCAVGCLDLVCASRDWYGRNIV